MNDGKEREKGHYLFGSKPHPAKYVVEEKKARNHGLAYFRKALKNRKESNVEAKRGIRTICPCSRKCFRKFTDESCSLLCQDFYRSGVIDDRRQFITRFVYPKVKVQRGDNTKTRTSNKYFIPSFYGVAPYKRRYVIEVCRRFFLAALNTTEYFVRWTLKKKVKNGWLIEKDKRGGSRQRNAISHQSFNEVCQNIASTSTIPPHYRREKDAGKMYVDSFHTISSMYRTYLTEKLAREEEIQLERETDLPVYVPKSVSLGVFYAIRRSYFPFLKFRRPKRDTCRTCLRFQGLDKQYLDRHPKLRLDYAHHRTSSNVARFEKLNDKLRALNPNSKSMCIYFDFEKNLESPCCK